MYTHYVAFISFCVYPTAPAPSRWCVLCVCAVCVCIDTSARPNHIGGPAHTPILFILFIIYFFILFFLNTHTHTHIYIHTQEPFHGLLAAHFAHRLRGGCPPRVKANLLTWMLALLSGFGAPLARLLMGGCECVYLYLYVHIW